MTSFFCNGDDPLRELIGGSTHIHQSTRTLKSVLREVMYTEYFITCQQVILGSKRTINLLVSHMSLSDFEKG